MKLRTPLVLFTCVALVLTLMAAPAYAQAEKKGKGEKKEMKAPTPPQPGMVWANPDSKVYHKEGSRWYGKTKNGKWMTEEDAKKEGYKEAGAGGKKSGGGKSKKKKT